MLEIEVIPMLEVEENYNFLLHDSLTRHTAVIDPSLADPILRILDKKGWKLTHILNTHHHWDHTDGNLALKEKTGAKIVGFSDDKARIPGIDEMVSDGQIYSFGNYEAHIMHLPAHTTGHIAYYFASEKALFSGDIVFLMGCGRLFEGDGTQMHAAFQKIASLPDDTRIFCGHEYTLKNGEFALTIDPENRDLIARMAEVRSKREQGIPSVPATLATEKATNPYLRCDRPEIRARLGMENASDAEVFTEIRRRKDRF